MANVYKSVIKHGPLFVDRYEDKVTNSGKIKNVRIGSVNTVVVEKEPLGVDKLMNYFGEFAEYFAGKFKISPFH